MNNHYHLLLSEHVDGGISLFLRRLNVGYANYFNERHARIGTLFQGRTKKIRIEHEAHFLYILHYIHLNPLDYHERTKHWRERSKTGIRSAREAMDYLDRYRWSSYIDYAGGKNFPSVISPAFFRETFGDYTKEIRTYLKDAEADNVALMRLE